jgi:hypothetical protein
MSAVESAAGREAKNICSVRALPVVTDAVEKVGGMPSVRATIETRAMTS